VVTPAPDEQIPPDSLWLFAGDLSNYYATRLERGELPAALLDRQVPTLAWIRQRSVVVAPTESLAPGEAYTLAAVGIGSVVSILVAPDARTPWLRVWPPRGLPSGGSYAVYCGGGQAPSSPLAAVLEPDALSVRVVPGADDFGTLAERCLHVAPLAELPSTRTLVPPPMVDSTPLDPEPLGTELGAPVVPRSCTTGEIAFGPGCATVEDDRIRLRVPDQPLLWMVRGLAEPVVEAVSPGRGESLMGLVPDSRVALDLTTVDLSGRPDHIALEVRSLPAVPHVVINEVLANPAGPEPAQEWVELWNTGLVDVDLAGWTLFDSSAGSALPAATLPAGQFALVVREDYVPDSLDDLPPAPGTLLLRVPRIGNGLTNSGEALRLETPGGTVMSRFAAVAQSQPGVSAVRHGPGAWDDDPAAFGLDPTGACSPGAPNPSL
jgi:hypothetical protein